MGLLGDYLSIHSNGSGFFDAGAYSTLVLEDVVATCVQRLGPEEWQLMLHDAATTHKGKKVPKPQQGQVQPETTYYHFDEHKKPQELNAWLKKRSIEEGDVPAGMASKRPNDKRWCNFLFW